MHLFTFHCLNTEVNKSTIEIAFLLKERTFLCKYFSNAYLHNFNKLSALMISQILMHNL